MSSMNGCAVKRRREEEETTTGKRYFDLNIQFSPPLPTTEPMPSITYASPDYRPPPPAVMPLWLQPTASSFAEEDSEDEPALLTPQNNAAHASYWTRHEPMSS
ncbi:hypothetical protein BY458DRAFT_513757 [Sporodiniella umbellata]|nr:hypothetical protein BY458DRAFT_513757 [Sporodiniella umbellata]